VFVGTAFYFIANSGWNALDEHGAMQSTRHLTSAVIMRVEVSALK
jgi:hypothetical protein